MFICLPFSFPHTPIYKTNNFPKVLSCAHILTGPSAEDPSCGSGEAQDLRAVNGKNQVEKWNPVQKITF